MTTKRSILLTFAILALFLSLLVTGIAADAAARRSYGRDSTLTEKFMAIVNGEDGYSAALKVGLGSSEYWANGQPHVIQQWVFKNDDKILIIDYLNNPDGLGISRREGETHFKIIAGKDAGREWQWAFSDPCSSSWTYFYGVWGDVGGFPASDICTDCTVAIYTHFKVGIDTETEVITIGSPPSPTPSPTLPPGMICTPGERECGTVKVNELWECNAAGNGWVKIETCAYGCENGACKSAPTPTPPPNIPGFGAIIAIAGLLAVAVVLLKKRAEAKNV